MRATPVSVLTVTISSGLLHCCLIVFAIVDIKNFGWNGGPWVLWEENCDLGFDLKQEISSSAPYIRPCLSFCGLEAEGQISGRILKFGATDLASGVGCSLYAATPW